MAIKTTPFDAAEYLGDTEGQAVLIKDAFETGDAKYIAHALGVVARSRGMSQLVHETGITREALYRALRKDGDPRLSTLIRVLSALGIKLRVDMAAPKTH